jgi:hypothetical protein
MHRAERCRRLAGLLLLAAWLPAAWAQPAPREAARLAALDAAGREALARRQAAWDALPEAVRRERREQWQAWRALPAEERARMGAARAAFLQRPVAEQQALRAQFDALDAGLRRGWLLGPVLGQDWPRLHALFAQVAPDERDALLVALRALPAQGRDDLAMLAQRTPPQDRAALRKALLEQAPAQRGDWLRRQVAP